MFVIAFLPGSKCLLISWLQSLSIMILEPKKIKSVTVSTFSPSVCHEVIEAENFPIICCQKTGDPESAGIVPIHKLVSSTLEKSQCFSLNLKAGKGWRPSSEQSDGKGILLPEEPQLCCSVQLCFFFVLAFSQYAGRTDYLHQGGLSDLLSLLTQMLISSKTPSQKHLE